MFYRLYNYLEPSENATHCFVGNYSTWLTYSSAQMKSSHRAVQLFHQNVTQCVDKGNDTSILNPEELELLNHLRDKNNKTKLFNSQDFGL